MAKFPLTRTPGGTSLVTTEPSVTTAPLPTVNSLEIVAFGPTQTSSPSVVLPQTSEQEERKQRRPMRT